MKEGKMILLVTSEPKVQTSQTDLQVLRIYNLVQFEGFTFILKVCSLNGLNVSENVDRWFYFMAEVCPRLLS